MLMADSNYPLASVLLTMLVFFGWVLWIWLLVLVYTDLFRREDIGGWGKFGWVLLTLFLPFIGVFFYLIAQGHKMQERAAARAAQQRRGMDDYIRSVAASPTSGDGATELAKARELLDRGAITPNEYETIKRKAVTG